MKRIASEPYDFLGSLTAVIVTVAAVLLVGDSVGLSIRIALYVLALLICTFSVPGLLALIHALAGERTKSYTVPEGYPAWLPTLSHSLNIHELGHAAEIDKLIVDLGAFQNEMLTIKTLNREKQKELLIQVTELNKELGKNKFAKQSLLFRRFRNIAKIAPDLMTVTSSVTRDAMLKILDKAISDRINVKETE